MVCYVHAGIFLNLSPLNFLVRLFRSFSQDIPISEQHTVFVGGITKDDSLLENLYKKRGASLLKNFKSEPFGT